MATKPVYKNGLPVVLDGKTLMVEAEETGGTSGGGWFLIGTYVVPETDDGVMNLIFSKDADGKDFSVREVMVAYNGTVKEGAQSNDYWVITLTDKNGTVSRHYLTRVRAGTAGTTYKGSTKFGIFGGVHRQESIGATADTACSLLGDSIAIENAVKVTVNAIDGSAGWLATMFAAGGKVTVYGRN